MICIFPGMPQRIPSPRELQYHTQSIMQNALIRKKLEEQRENFRKRQEAQAQAQQQNNNSVNNTALGGASQSSNTTSTITSTPAQAPIQGNAMSMGATHSSPVKHTASPTPLAFTPTSVLRKMTAEKDTDVQNNAPSSAGNTASIVSASAGGNALLNSIANSGNKTVQIQGPMPGNLLQQQQRLLVGGTSQSGPNSIQQQLSNVMANVQIGQSIRGIPQNPPQNMAVAVQQPTVRTASGPQNMSWLQQQMQAQNQASKSQGMSK